VGESAQRPVVDFLLDPKTHGLGPGGVEHVETHIAIVVLAGDRAYKLKRAVRLPFLDFYTLAQREAACRAEIRLNRRTAPDIYLGVVAITREADGSLALGGQGTAIDWVVMMRRFDQSRLLDRLAQRGELGAELALSLAATIVRFHEQAEPVAEGADAAEYRRLIEVNDDMLRRFADNVFEAEAVAELRQLSEQRLETQASLIAARMADGRVRHCHGDLHLRNIFLDGERPVLFDAIEFDDRLARTDVIYDLAFLLMDLWHRGLTAFANAVLNRYLLLSGDYAGLALMPLFLSLRAAIRAHVSATTAQGAEEAGAAALLRDEARAYLALAHEFLRPATPRLIAVGGYSGSGKSTLARGLAPALPPPPGAVVARSDEIRKHLMGVAPESPLGETAYAPSVSRRVYAEMRRVAAEVLAAGYTAVADAVHDRATARRQLAALARRAGVAFHGFWLDAGPEVMARRIDARTSDASDATAAVMHEQRRRGRTAGNWQRLDAEHGAGAVLTAALGHLSASAVEHDAD